MTGEKDGDTTPVTHFALIFSLLRLGDTSARRFANLIESIQRNTSSTFTNWWTYLVIRSASSCDAHAGSDWDILIILNKDTLLPDNYNNATFPLTTLG